MNASDLVLPIFNSLHKNSQFSKRCTACSFRALTFGKLGKRVICLIDTLPADQLACVGLFVPAALRLCAGYARRN